MLSYHDVDGVLQIQNLSLGIDGNFLGQISLGNSLTDVCNVTDLGCQVRGHSVDIVRKLLPSAIDLLDFGLTTKLALCADLTSDSCDLGSEG